MRIWFTLNISADLAEADVSWNSLFIGIWTTLEVSLVFVVACTLSLPKLVQAKGKKFRVAWSCASASFSAIPGIVRRKTGQGDKPSTSQGRANHVRGSSWEDIELDDNRAKWIEETHWRREQDARSSRPSRAFNSDAADGNDCSRRTTAGFSRHGHDGFQQQQLQTPELSTEQRPWKSEASP